MTTPSARRSDPVTSHDAAAQAGGLAARHHTSIIACLEAHGAQGKDQIGAHTYMTGVQVCRRLKELERGGSIRPTGRTVRSVSGRSEREWEATK